MANKCKYYKLVRQVSYNSGQTWSNVDPPQYQQGDLYESGSTDCGDTPTPTGTTIYRWTDIVGEYTCVGTTKYQKTKKQVSYDDGNTWEDVIPLEYGTSSVIEEKSTDCSYVPKVSYYNNGVLVAQDNCEKLKVMNCDGDYYHMEVPEEEKPMFAGSYNNVEIIENEFVTDIVFGDCCKYIAGYYYADSSKSYVTSITFSDSVEYIGCGCKSAFVGFSGIKSVVIHNLKQTFGGTFYGCTSLETVELPNTGFTEISSSDFRGCTSLKRFNSSVDGVANIPNDVTVIGRAAFMDCTSITNFNINNKCQEIKHKAFIRCSMTTMNIPDNVSIIGEITDEVFIDTGVFGGCTSLTSITIGSGCTLIGDFTFYGCTNLSSFTIKAVNPPTLGRYALTTLATTPPTIYVPASSIDEYKATKGWRTYASRIQPIP